MGSASRLKSIGLLSWSVVRAMLQMLSSAPVNAGWGKRQRFTVLLIRDLLHRVKDLPGTEQREILASPVGPLPPGIVETCENLGDFPAWRWTPPSADMTRRVVHFHGGGYVIGCGRQVRSFLAGLAAGLGVPVISVDYRLAPEHPYPAAIDDGEVAVRAVMAQGVRPQDILLAGDSAGGGVALATLLRLRDAGVILGGAILGSPWLDLSMPGASIEANATTDYIHRAIASRWARLYTDGQLDHPEVSPGLADLKGLPPIHLAIGDLECLRDDLLAVAHRLQQADVDVDVNLADAAVHCWYTQPGVLPGPADGVARMVSFGRRVWGQ